MTRRLLAANVATVWKDGTSEAAQWWNTERPLAHPLDLGEEGLAMKATQCSIPGCNNPPKARGWCDKHWWRWSNHGDPNWEPTPRPQECSFDGCDMAPRTRGLCLKHYTRLKRTGTTEKREGPTQAQHLARFMANISVLGENDCWPWRGTILSSGYGQFAADGRRYLAHRYAYEAFVGPIPDGLQIDHVRARGCTRTDCVNPAHLEAVTPQVNLRRSNAISAVNARKERCPRGHDYEFSKDGKRFCRTCRHRKQEAT